MAPNRAKNVPLENPGKSADEAVNPSAMLAQEKIEELVRNARVSPDLKSEKLEYILEMLLELQKLAATVDEPMIAYLLEMALLETNTAINVQNAGLELMDRSHNDI